MKTEITRNKLSEWFYPTENFRQDTDKDIIDYAEIEINPNGIKKIGK